MLSRTPHEASSWFVFVWFSFLIFIRPPTQQRFCFSHDALWQGAGNTDKGKHLKPTSHTNLPSSAQPQNKKKELWKKKITENMVMLFTQLSLIFLDLNYKHTSIFHLHISPTYSVPLDRYSLLLLKTLLSCQQCLKESIEWQSGIQDRAVWFVSHPDFCITL